MTMVADHDDAEWQRSIAKREKRLLAELHRIQGELRKLEALKAPNSRETHKTVSGPIGKRKPPKAQHGEFRNRIQDIVSTAGRPLKASEVTRLLEQSGFTKPAKTNLSARVSTELYKLKQAGRLSSTADGYVLPFVKVS
jgi:hypothetical protein